MSGIKHILYISDNYPPEINAPAARVSEHAESWVRSGCNVTVITCAPNFPDGEVYEGYKNTLWSSEIINGVRVIRVWSFMASNDGFFKRIIDFISFMMSASMAGIFVRNVDVVIGTSPQFFTLCAAWFIAKIKSKKLFLEIRDLWPESIIAVGAIKNKWLISIISTIEYFLYRSSYGIIVLTESFKNAIVGGGINPDKIQVVTNGVNTKVFYPMKVESQLKEKLLGQYEFLAGYIGTHGYAQSLENIIEVAKKCQENEDSIGFIFVGGGARKNG